MPGPGNYSFDGRNIGKNAPAVTMRGKTPRKDTTESPGPGAYYPTQTLQKEAARSYQMGKSNRTEIVSKEKSCSPGPGNYSLEDKSRGPSYSFHPAREEKRDNLSPGPG